MSEGFSRPIVLDATVLSNFASTDSVSWLVSSLEGLTTVPAVETELRRGRDAGYDYLSNALEVVESDQIDVDETAPDRLERAYPDVRATLDPGEAEALVAADTGRGRGTLATDDGAARELASAYEIGLTGSVGLLVRGVVLDELTVDVADDWLATWIDERNYYSPVERVTDALPDDYE